ncbi:MAG: hypothetical protein CMF26_03650 [Kiloniella sp.]|nr:hypothetical protein [Kiloniella sp.]
MRLGLIAGGGGLPDEVLAHSGRDIHQCFRVGAGCEFSLGAVAALVAAAQAAGCDALCLVGSVDRRDFTALDLGGRWVAERARTRSAATGTAGDGSLLDALVAYFEDHGLRVVGVDDICPDLLTPAGVLIGDSSQVSTAQQRQGLAKARALGLTDRGQAVIACGLPTSDCQWLEEGEDGTDALIDRAGASTLQTPKILFKALKPQQDRRIDLPAWGPETVHRAVAAGLDALVFEAGASLAVDRQRALKLAQRHGLTVIGGAV